MFDITGKPSDELKHIVQKLQVNDMGGDIGRRIRTYLAKAPAIRGAITDGNLSFLPVRSH